MTAHIPEIIAHRGESFDAPENTLAAFNLAWQGGADAVELDVHLTADNRLICIHDADTQRTTGTARLVREATLDELRQLDAGSWKSPQYAGQRMPALDEVLPTIPPGKRLFIELKVGPESVQPMLEALHRAGAAPDQIAVISFNLDTCRLTKCRAPQLAVYYLAACKYRRWSER